MENFFQDRDKLANWLPYAQGALFLTTGLWLIVGWLMFWPSAGKTQTKQLPLNRFDREAELSDVFSH